MFHTFKRYTISLNRLIHSNIKQSFINNIRNDENKYTRRLSCSHRIPCCNSRESFDILNVRNYSATNYTDRSQGIQAEFVRPNLSKVVENIYSIISKNNRVYLKNVTEVISAASRETIVDHESALMMIKCCSNLLLDVSPEKRMTLLNQVLEILKKTTKFDLDHYDELLKCYIDNNHKFDTNAFLKNMLPLQPSALTYHLLLSSACKVGEMQQALDLIQNMKNDKIVVSENAFNCLIEGYGKSGNIDAALEVIDTLKSTLKNVSAETEKSIIIAYIFCNREDIVKERLSHVKNSKLSLSEIQVIEIIKCLSHNNMNNLIPDFLSLLPLPVLSSLSYHILNMCTQLIHRGYPLTAFMVYNHISTLAVGSNNIDFYMKSLIRETVMASDNIEDICFITKQIEESSKNNNAIYIALQTALHFNKNDIALGLMGILKKQNKPVRCHFFWPLFVKSAKETGEAGVYKVISSMISLNITPDLETLVDYVIPNISMINPMDVIQKFKHQGVDHSASLTPILYTLIKSGDIKNAADLCDLTEGHLDCEKLISPLVRGFLSSYDVDSVHNILKSLEKRSHYPNKDWIGKFLINLFSLRNWQTDKKNFVDLIRALSESDTKVSTQSVDKCIYYLSKLECGDLDTENMRLMLTTMIDTSKKIEAFNVGLSGFGQQNDMNVLQLEAHLLELKSKKMNTRGVLRKLLQKYCQLVNIDEAKRILEICQEKQIFLSDGMKASVMDMYIKSNDLQNAELYYNEFKKSKSNFDIDNFKILDYCTLLVKNNRINDAIQILEKTTQQQSLLRGKLNLERNCWRLLEAVATTVGPMEAEKMLSFLSRLGYCKISNILLGPLIRAHLLRFDVSGAVNEFINCAHKYRKTPLKHELLCILVMGSYDYKQAINKKDTELCSEKGLQIQNDYKNLLVKVQESETNVHGIQSSRLSLMAALAENGLSKPLRRFVLTPSFVLNNSDVKKQCERFSNENKVKPMEILADSLEGVRDIKRNEIYDYIVKLHHMNDDCDSAVKMWEKIIEQDIKPTKNTIDVLVSMLTTNHRNIPHTLAKNVAEN